VKKPFSIFGFSIMQPIRFSQTQLDIYNSHKEIAFSRFYDTYRSDVKLRVNRKLGVFYGDQDLVNDIFCKMFDLEGTFDTIGSLELYLFRVTSSTCEDYLKKQKTPVVHMGNAQQFYQRIEDRTKVRAEIKEVAKVLHDVAIQQLPSQCRDIFIMHFIWDMRNKEIAERLQISVKTVENQINIALKKLRMEVGNDAGKMYLIKLLLPLLWTQLTSL
jgi:RNA polymerase sigma-70 factor, ECF subfamily